MSKKIEAKGNFSIGYILGFGREHTFKKLPNPQFKGFLQKSYKQTIPDESAQKEEFSFSRCIKPFYKN